MGEPELRSGRLADAAGVNVQTLRCYERRGLLPAPRRSPGGHRLYPAETVTLLRVVKAAQRLLPPAVRRARRPGRPAGPRPGVATV
ncbi:MULTISPECIES: MerR family DNA-binding transcriptional regulator [unclassified Micromonospora]|uniref:MerR family DNA-binding transcriptional regulator n=1 Tax=unclassified Micromonospora TaxID=2617518 RepID=UPI001E6551B3|nr:MULTISPECIES: MerR family DNA-binding transcriptional regulator [unclassified Micromonospora]MCZ7475242.1 MerR family DNA-binding transcriptional regulator [Micromonospora sp. WMMC273]WBC05857.1 MerR family DNA-binding transcriptional regulator [Micromonospora sp. WMMA1976]